MKNILKARLSRVLILCFLATISVLMFLYANQNKQSATTWPQLESAVDLQNQWTKDDDCQAPCWNGIIPGKTSLLQSLDILLSNDEIKDIRVAKFTGRGVVEWDWDFSLDEKGGRLFFDNNQIVYGIEPGVISRLSLGEMINKFDSPSHILIYEVKDFELQDGDQPYYSHSIIWLGQGLYVEGAPLNGGNIIDEKFIIYSIGFFEPNIDGLLKYRGHIVDRMVAWQGYNNQSIYIK